MIWTILLTQVALAEQPKVAKKQKTTDSLTFEYGYLDIADESLITDWRNNATGLRFEKGLSSSLSALGGWRLDGAVTYFDDEYGYDYGDYGYYDYEEPVYSTQYLGELDALLVVNTITGGVKYSHKVKRWLHPYATLQGQVSHGYLVLTDDIEEEKDRRTFNINAQSVGVGGVGSFGVEFRTPKVGKVGQLISYLEGGYIFATDLNFSYSSGEKAAESIEIGKVGQSGQFLRWGVGFRFATCCLN